MARLTVFGLNMADTTYADILAAVRGTYPTETAGLSDARAVQSVLKMWVTDLMARWHGTQAADPSAAAEAALQQALTTRHEASDAARLTASTDIQVTAP